LIPMLPQTAGALVRMPHGPNPPGSDAPTQRAATSNTFFAAPVRECGENCPSGINKRDDRQRYKTAVVEYEIALEPRHKKG